ncbi:uncharacterized protein J3R85_013343 [Psidium guajava]|nr:uncharacterized protein J3R85_013343 [Psidium guajava]
MANRLAPCHYWVRKISHVCYVTMRLTCHVGYGMAVRGQPRQRDVAPFTQSGTWHRMPHAMRVKE